MVRHFEANSRGVGSIPGRTYLRDFPIYGFIKNVYCSSGSSSLQMVLDCGSIYLEVLEAGHVIRTRVHCEYISCGFRQFGRLVKWFLPQEILGTYLRLTFGSDGWLSRPLWETDIEEQTRKRRRWKEETTTLMEK